MDYAAYFQDLADYYNHSRIPSKVMTGAAELRAEYNQAGSWVQECAKSLQAESRTCQATLITIAVVLSRPAASKEACTSRCAMLWSRCKAPGERRIPKI